MYEARGLGKHRPCGDSLPGCMLTYEGVRTGNGTYAAWLQGMAAACADFKAVALRAAKDARYQALPAVCYCQNREGAPMIAHCDPFTRFLGGVREDFGPTPHVIYIVCPSCRPKELRSALVDAALALQPCCEELSVAAGVCLRRTDNDSSTAASTAGQSADAVSPQAEVETHYILMRGLAEGQAMADESLRLRLLILQVRPHTLSQTVRTPLQMQGHDAMLPGQVVSEDMLMDITGQAARFLALSSYSRQLQASR